VQRFGNSVERLVEMANVADWELLGVFFENA
jgi:hypothetical protein